MHPDDPIPAEQRTPGYVATEQGLVYYRIAKETREILVWSGDQRISLSALQQAAKEIRKRFAPFRLPLMMLLVPPTEDVLDVPISENQTMKLLDEALIAAAVHLGHEERTIREICSYGMGSDYRGWLAYVRECAMKSIDDRERADLAWELIMLTSAVAVSMRHGYATFAYTRATALRAMAHFIPEHMLQAQQPPFKLCTMP